MAIDEKMREIEAPLWMLSLFRAIDALDLSEAGGLSVFADDVLMIFGTHQVKGIDAVKAFFASLDAPYRTVHNVLAVWNAGDTYFMQGSADITKRSDAGATIHTPVVNLMWLNEGGKVQQYIVGVPPAAVSLITVG